MTNTGNLSKKVGQLQEIKEFQVQVLKYLQSSRMQTKEKKMWLAMIPYLSKQDLERLFDILKRESEELIDLCMSFLEKK